MPERLVSLKAKYLARKIAPKNRPNPGTAGNGRAGSFGAGWKKKPKARAQGCGVRKRAYGPF